MGAFTPRHPWGMLSLPKVVQGSLYPMLRATFPPPIPSLGAVMGPGEGGGRAEPCCSPPPSPLGHRAVLGTGGPRAPAPGGAS